MARKEDKGARLAGGIILIVGLGLLAGGGYTGNQQYTILKSWPAVDAQVTKSQVTHERSSSGSGTTYSVGMEFRYRVGEKEYVTPSHMAYSTGNYAQMKGIADVYAPETFHSLRYNPSNPGDIRFNAGYNFHFS